MTRRRKWILGGSAMVLLGVLGTGTYLSSTRFSKILLERIREQVLLQTGMRLDAGGLAVQAWRGRVTLKQAVLHGTELAGEEPLLRLKEVRLDIGLRTLASQGISFRAVLIEEPRIHLLIDEQGNTNLPKLPGRTGVRILYSRYST